METIENNENTEVKQEQEQSKPQEQMQETKEQEVKKPDDVLILPVSGLEVKMDTTKATGHALMQARQESNGGATSGVFLIAKLATFDGEQKTGFDILDLDAEDVLALEDYYIQKKTYQILTRKKLLQSQK
ncbi:MAG: hypothetical protein ACI4SM_05050 [Candidatus Gastranaerophilaceae bacterium]